MSDEPKLAPCPFCGNDGAGPIEDALHIIFSEHEYRDPSWCVQCDKCTATMGHSESEEEAVEAWNRRVPAPAVPDDVAATPRPRPTTTTIAARIAKFLSDAGEAAPSVDLLAAALDAHTAAQPAPDHTDLSWAREICDDPEKLDAFMQAHPLPTQPAPDAVAEAAWSGVENAPYDTPLTVLAGGMTFAAILRRDASLNDDGESCDQWQAVVEGEHPPCWTDGACWESNEDGIPCLWPEAFMPLTKPAGFRTATKGPSA